MIKRSILAAKPSLCKIVHVVVGWHCPRQQNEYKSDKKLTACQSDIILFLLVQRSSNAEQAEFRPEREQSESEQPEFQQPEADQSEFEQPESDAEEALNPLDTLAEAVASQPVAFRNYKGQSRQMITMTFLEEGGLFDMPIQVGFCQGSLHLVHTSFCDVIFLCPTNSSTTGVCIRSVPS